MRVTPTWAVEGMSPVVAPDGIRFVMAEVEAVATLSRIVMVLNVDVMIREALGL